MIQQSTADRITAERLRTLRPDFRARAEMWLAECREAGLNVYVYCGARTCREQDALFAKGRAVTRARGGQSFHNYGRALDFVPLVANKKNPGFFDAGWEAAPLYKRAAAIAAKYGMKALSWETPHLQDANFSSYTALPRKELIP